jgi:hypothetical protein
MRADEFAAELRGLTIPGATVRSADGKPGSGLQYGFLVTGQHGGRMAWQVALQKDGAQAGANSPTFPAAVPAQPDKLVAADVEASIAAWIGQSELAEHVTELVRYSTNGSVSALRYGLRLTLDEGGRVFIQVLWTLEPGENPTPDYKYEIRDAV